MTTLVMIAKETIPGRVKTRLHPPLSLEQAAELAAASIQDTLAAVASLPASRRILLFDGKTPPENTEGWEIMPQVDGGLDERLGAMFDECEGPTVLIGMDTPQVTAADLLPAFGPWRPGVDAWFGPATDGGFWALALASPDGDLLRGVPMSRVDTGAIQFDRLRAAGLGVGLLRPLTDVDTIEDAWRAAGYAPHSAFAKTLVGFRHDEWVAA
ncbi:MAG: hypothetical protein JWO10_1580 [Microbacteriaceae bacterium]|nr:hypothetical protein [Microbacteriaceae bacterium]